MQLNDLLAMVEDHQRGAWLELRHPITGEKTGMRLKIAGPDSDTQARARALMVDELAELADLDGRASGAVRDQVRQRLLARCVLDWEIKENNEPVPFSFEACLRLLRAGTWAQAQIDAFADNRRAFGGAV
jgi:hypothetical protein